MSKTLVPFADLHAQYLSIQSEIDFAIAEIIRTSSFIRGPHVEKFEEQFATAIGTKRCVSCANGTDGLYIAMHALGVSAGDEVITTAHSWIATAETITQAGGKVVFCDTNRETFNIDANRIEELITARTVGIIPVHLYGHPAQMDKIMAIAAKHKLWVIEDCAQAHLAKFGGQNVGTFGVVGTFSFYPGKNLGAMGDAGAIVTSDAGLADRMAMFARHGGLKKGEHLIEGINSRLDALQAAILTVKLRHLPAWTRARQRLAEKYNAQLRGDTTVGAPKLAAGCEHVYHLYTILHERRSELAVYLADLGIQTAINYPVALPFVPAYARLGHTPKDFPNAHFHQERILSLPIYSEMSDEQVEQVAKAIHDFGT
jgi:dTDP-4-amino-4,6-dideoxygalactose transaminase